MIYIFRPILIVSIRINSGVLVVLINWTHQNIYSTIDYQTYSIMLSKKKLKINLLTFSGAFNCVSQPSAGEDSWANSIHWWGPWIAVESSTKWRWGDLELSIMFLFVFSQNTTGISWSRTLSCSYGHHSHHTGRWSHWRNEAIVRYIINPLLQALPPQSTQTQANPKGSYTKPAAKKDGGQGAPKPGPVLTYPRWDCRLPSVLRWGLNEGHPPAACTVCPWCLSHLQNCHPAAHSHAHWPCTSSATTLGQFYRPQPWLAHTWPQSRGLTDLDLTILCLNLGKFEMVQRVSR